MSTIAEELRRVDNFSKLLPFLKDHMGWPVDPSILNEDDPLDELTFEFEPKELGIDPEKSSNIREIRMLRPLSDSDSQFGVFLISFDDKELKITTMRRLLRALVKKKRKSAMDETRQHWHCNDLMFISNFGHSGHRKLSFAHFHEDDRGKELPILRVIGWDEDDTPMRMQIQADELTKKLRFPVNSSDVENWPKQWTTAFRHPPGHVIKTTKALVSQLAKLATRTRRAIEDVLGIETQTGVLHVIMNSFKQAIFPDLTPEAFADMYAQTVAYGLLQTGLSNKQNTLALDDTASLMGIANPFLKEVFESFLAVGGNKSRLDFDEIGLSEVRYLLSDTDMKEVLADFNRKNPSQDPKIHLYERFLEEYDKEYDPGRKKQRGVFYTPREVVGFIVRSVHETLQTDFGLADGLADVTTWKELADTNNDIIVPDGWGDRPFVQILDPATGTGAFLIEAIDLIYKRLTSRWQSEGKSKVERDVLWQAYVPEYLLPRLYGFEFMMAPYAMTHLGIALKLIDTEYTPEGDGPRANVYLTDSLAGPLDSGAQFVMDFLEEALAEESRGANAVKSDVPITVVLGNPPYSGHSMNAGKWINELIEPYFFLDGVRITQINMKWLRDDYVKFFRLGQHCLERSGCGVLSYITNHSFIDNLTAKGMRKHLIDGSTSLKILDLHGNSKKKEKGPDGSLDENVFDIEQGVAVAVFVKCGSSESILSKGDMYGSRKEKLKWLSNSAMSDDKIAPLSVNAPHYRFMSYESELEPEFQSFYPLDEIFPLLRSGVVTTHDEFAISFNRDELIGKMKKFSDSFSEREARSHFKLCKSKQWNYESTKGYLQNQEFCQDIADIVYRAFDTRATVFNNHVAINKKEPVMKHMLNGRNIGLATVRQMSSSGQSWSHVYVSNRIVESSMISNRSKEICHLLPLKLYPINHSDIGVEANISNDFLIAIGAATCLEYRSVTNNDRGDLVCSFGCRDIFDYIYAVLHSPSYRSRYAHFLKSDFPRVPLPNGKSFFSSMVSIGRELVDLHLLDETHPKLSRPAIVFRGRGNNQLGVKSQIKLNCGKMEINSSQWFEDIPVESAEFWIGGYQPLVKWLHDRAKKEGKNAMQGRVLSDVDIVHYRRMAVAITETRCIMQQISILIKKHNGWHNAFVIR